MKSGSEIDFADIFANGIGNLLLSFLVLLGALWVGHFAGELSVIAGGLADGYLRSPLLSLLSHPYEAILTWILPGLMGLGAVWLKFGRLDGSGGILWGILVGLIALGRVGFEVERLDAWLPITVAHATCVVLIGMICTGLWFLRQWQVNRWATEMAMLQAENAARRSQLEEEFGTEFSPSDPQ